MTQAPISLAFFLLGVWLLAQQPGAIPLGYAAARRCRRRGGRHPVLAGLAGWVIGCLLTGLLIGGSAAVLNHLGPDPTWLVLLLGYLPVWLLAWLLIRPTMSAASTAASDNGPKGEDNDVGRG